MTEAELVSGAHYLVMLAANQRMDDELKVAKNKQGMVQKYLHTIPARSKPDWKGDPFDFGERSEVDNLYASAAIGIGMHMHDKLTEYLHG